MKLNLPNLAAGATILAVAASGTLAADRDSSSSSSVLTPEKLIQAPRPAIGPANPSGTAALVGVTLHTLADDSSTSTKSLYVVPLSAADKGAEDLASHAHLKEIVKGATSGLWLNDDEILYLSGDSLYVKNVNDATPALAEEKEAKKEEGGEDKKNENSDDAKTDEDKGALLTSFPTSVDSMRIAQRGDEGGAVLVFSAQVYEDGKLESVKPYEESPRGKVWDRVKIYDDLYVRHWDAWKRPGKRNKLFSVELRRDRKGYNSSWGLASEYRNLLNATTLASPVPPFGAEGDYDVSPKAGLVAFTAKDPVLPEAWHTKQNIYVVPIDGSEPPREVTEGEHGATSSPTFSPDGKVLAWFQMRLDRFESDRRILTLHHLESGATSQLFVDWDRSPTSLTFAKDGKTLFLLAEDFGREKVFTAPLDVAEDGRISTSLKEPVELIGKGGTSAVSPLPQGGALLAKSSLRSPTDLFLLPSDAKLSSNADASLKRLTDFVNAPSSTLKGVDFGPEAEHFSYKGAKDREAYGWIVRPSGFKVDKKYPVCVLIHGGPEGSWSDSWSTRWNPAVFANDHCFVVTFNPAGSTGYGMALQEEILENWGGAPFEDIVAGVEHVLQRFPDNVDAERMIAAGASYGGFMVNWIQGHNDDLKHPFKALVSHDGVSNTAASWYTTEELFFAETEHGGLPWEKGSSYEKWNPERFADKWNTPQLTIAGSKDYRLPDTNGLSMHTALIRRGVASKLIVFPEENHWVLKPDNSLVWHQQVLGWIRRWTTPGAASDDAKAQGAQNGGLVFQKK